MNWFVLIIDNDVTRIKRKNKINTTINDFILGIASDKELR